MSSWSYGSQEDSTEDKPSPNEVVEKLERHRKWGQRLQNAIRGDIRKTPTDNPVRETAFLVKYIKKATHETGARPPGVMDTLSYIATKWPRNDRGQPRWWTREDKPFTKANAYVFSSETDPEDFLEDPRPEWYKQQQSEEAERHETQVRSAFWECIRDAKGGMVFARPADVAAHPDVEIDEERVWDLLHDWRAVESVDDPHSDTPAPLNQKQVFAIVEQ